MEQVWSWIQLITGAVVTAVITVVVEEWVRRRWRRNQV
jgi:hypothetical protein